MKRTLLALAISCSTVSSFAQKINYGIKAGINLANQTLNSPTFTNDYKHLLGFNAGGFVEMQYNKVILQSGLYYTAKGFSIDAPLYNQYPVPNKLPTLNFRLNYIELPLNLLYWCKISNNTTMHLGGGPYFAYHFKVLGGESNDNNFYAPAYFTFRNSDYGFIFIAGLKIKNRFIIDASYGLGLANFGNNRTTAKNTVISLSVGYQFN